MTKYNTLNVNMSNSHFNKLKSGTKNVNEVTLNFSSNLIRNSNDQSYYQYKLLLIDTQDLKIRRNFSKWFIS